MAKRLPDTESIIAALKKALAERSMVVSRAKVEALTDHLNSTQFTRQEIPPLIEALESIAVRGSLAAPIYHAKERLRQELKKLNM